MTHPTFVVQCSCGRKTYLHWHEPLHRYISTDVGWFPSWPAGWTCGRANHQQVVPPQIFGQESRWDYFKPII